MCTSSLPYCYLATDRVHCLRSRSRSRISASNLASALGSGGAAGFASSALRLCVRRVNNFTNRNMQNAMIMKSNVFCKNSPYCMATSSRTTVPSAATWAGESTHCSDVKSMHCSRARSQSCRKPRL